MKHYFINLNTKNTSDILYANVGAENSKQAKEKVRQHWIKNNNQNIKGNKIESMSSELIKDWDESWLRIFKFWTVDLDE